MNLPIVDPAGMRIALQSRMEQNQRLGDRTQYVGASEIGSCLRRVVSSKLYPEQFDQASMGRMLAGKALENEVVQLVRIALKGRLRNTGRVQLNLQHQTLPFQAHPDGIALGGIDGLDGEGILEVKTASSSTFQRFQKEGLPTQYLDQVQAQMGLSPGMKWALLVLVSRENLADQTTFTIRFNPEHYARLEKRAEQVASVLADNNILTGLYGETDRGFCYSCPYSRNCESFCALREAGQRGEIPEVTRLQIECQLEELSSLESISGPMQTRIAEIRELLKIALLNSGASKVVLDNGTVQMVESSRTSFDSKSLQREAPDLYSRFQKTSTFSTLRINFKGATQCLSTAS